MLKSFLVLDLPMDASDQEIRKKYLELVKTFTPEKFPVQFQKVTAAYESVKNQRSRVKSRLFAALKDADFENTLKELAGSVKFNKKKCGLKELLNAASGK
ncbi:MAG: J domain-containing protein [Desulfamplus sp.]|nr:J domain-containing protein [Desulfamplus sp.]